MTQTYRISNDVVIDGAALVNGFVATKPCDEPQPKVEMYCDQLGCHVQEIVLEVPFVTGGLPVLHCPACGHPLRFVSYLEEVRLVPSDTPRCETIEDAFREIKSGAV